MSLSVPHHRGSLCFSPTHSYNEPFGADSLQSNEKSDRFDIKCTQSNQTQNSQ